MWRGWGGARGVVRIGRFGSVAIILFGSCVCLASLLGIQEFGCVHQPAFCALVHCLGQLGTPDVVDDVHRHPCRFLVSGFDEGWLDRRSSFAGMREQMCFMRSPPAGNTYAHAYKKPYGGFRDFTSAHFAGLTKSMAARKAPATHFGV